ncbi:MAG TPA: hypothetical protein VFS43_17310 [Polyangiaceae bacterium]|nr:hypothetical protein [Polyangiaceae bacterium]
MSPAPPERDPVPAAPDAPTEGPRRFDLRAYPAPARVAAAALRALAALNLAYLGAHVFYDIAMGTNTAPPEPAALGFLTLSALPWLSAALLGRLFRATLAIEAKGLTLALGETRYEIPLASVKALRPFALPLPGPGLALELGEGRLFRYRLQLDAPGALLSALADDVEPARAALGRPPVAYADAKHEASRRRWHYHALKWVVWPLGIALVLFRLNQYIMYGGPFGQYQMYGAGPYLRSLATYWGGVTAVLALYAAALRAVAEPAVFAATWLAPARARTLRRAAEAICQLAYFVLVPALLALRLLQ